MFARSPAELKLVKWLNTPLKFYTYVSAFMGDSRLDSISMVNVAWTADETCLDFSLKIYAIPEAWNVPFLLCDERFNELACLKIYAFNCRWTASCSSENLIPSALKLVMASQVFLAVGLGFSKQFMSAVVRLAGKKGTESTAMDAKTALL